MNEILQWAVLVWLVFYVCKLWRDARTTEALVLATAAIINEMLGEKDDKTNNDA